MPKKIYFTEEQEKEIIKLYKNELCSLDIISEKLKVSPGVIARIVKENGAYILPGDKKRLLYSEGKIKNGKKIDFTEEQKDEMVRLYREEFLNPIKIGNKFNCSESPISRILKERDVERNGVERNKKLFSLGKFNIPKGENHYAYGKEAHNIIKFSLEQKREIIRLYKEEFKSALQIGKIIGVDSTVILRILHELGIDTNISDRHKELYQAGKLVPHNKGKPFLVMEKNPRWLGGISFEPYTSEFNKAFKLLIKQRDGFLCTKCGMREEDSLVLFKQKLHVHHINYEKKVTILENCCSLCLRCNAEVNSNRSSWTKFFQSLLSERYGYKYSENGDIILEVKNEKTN